MPKKAPSVIRNLGQTQRHRLITNEPDVPAGLPPPLPEMTERAAAIYSEYGKLLLDAGVLKRTDIATLQTFAAITALLHDAMAEYKRQLEGPSMPDFKSVIPVGLVASQRQYAVELGLTPSQRARLKVDKKDKSEEMWDALDETR